MQQLWVCGSRVSWSRDSTRDAGGIPAASLESQPLHHLHLCTQLLLLQLPSIFPDEAAWNCNEWQSVLVWKGIEFSGCPGALLEQHPPALGSSQWNWSNNRTHGRGCGLGYQTQLPGKIFQTLWVSLWPLTATPHRHSSLAPKTGMVIRMIRTHSRPGNALRAPTPAQPKLSFSDVQPLKMWDFLAAFSALLEARQSPDPLWAHCKDRKWPQRN